MDGADESAGNPADGPSVPDRPGEECPQAVSLAAKIDRLAQRR